MDGPHRVALALGGGGARGYAHIGAIQVLEERGIEIVGVAGSSMGALVGGIYAADKLEEFTEWARALTQRDVLRLLDVSFTAPGAIRAEKLLAYVRELIGGELIENLRVPFTAVATDLIARREVWFQRGPLDLAIRASIALPGIFTPVVLDGRLLADGGLMDPIPIAPTAAIAADATIAVSLGGERAGLFDAPVQETTESRPIDQWVERFRRGASRALETDVLRSVFSGRAEADSSALRDQEPTELEREPGMLPAGLSRFDVMNYALEAMQTLVTAYRLAGFPPDIVITVPKDACRTLDFHLAANMIELGRALATRALDDAGPAVAK